MIGAFNLIAWSRVASCLSTGYYRRKSEMLLKPD